MQGMVWTSGDTFTGSFGDKLFHFLYDRSMVLFSGQERGKRQGEVALLAVRMSDPNLRAHPTKVGQL